MKVVAIIVPIGVLAFAVFLYLHSKSIDRAWLINARSELTSAQQQLRRHGSITNVGRRIHVQVFTNGVSLGGAEFVPELAAYVPGWTNKGFLAMTRDGVFIWMDKNSGPMVVGGGSHPYRVPSRFRGF